MPNQGDTVEVAYVQELDGVQMSNRAYYAIDDLGNDDSVADNLNKLINSYQTATAGVCGNEWKIVCATYQNITSAAEKQTVFATVPGLAPGDEHPQNQVIRFNQYAQTFAPTSPVYRGAWNQSGSVESLSTRGRVNAEAPVNTLAAWLTGQIVLPTGGWTVQNLLRRVASPGPPIVYEYPEILKCENSARIFKLRTRTTNLCAVS